MDSFTGGSEMKHAEIAANARKPYADALRVATDALYSILNVEGPAMAGGRLGAWNGVDVAWHFDKVRGAINRIEGNPSKSRPCADCDSGAPNIPPHECTKYDA